MFLDCPVDLTTICTTSESFINTIQPTADNALAFAHSFVVIAFAFTSVRIISMMRRSI